MPRPRKQDHELLEAAIAGFQHMRNELDQKIAALRSQLGTNAGGAGRDGNLASPGRRTMSAAARRRIALAQKKRWAAFKARHGAKAAPKAHKRVLSAEGRARIIAATKKRWAAFRKSQQAKGA